MVHSRVPDEAGVDKTKQCGQVITVTMNFGFLVHPECRRMLQYLWREKQLSFRKPLERREKLRLNLCLKTLTILIAVRKILKCRLNGMNFIVDYSRVVLLFL